MNEQQTELLTESELAEVLRVSLSTVIRLRRAGRLPYLRIGRQIRYRSSVLRQFAIPADIAASS